MVALTKWPYENRAPAGRAFTYPWGCLAVLNELHAQDRSIYERSGVVCAWVGDLLSGLPLELRTALISRIRCLEQSDAEWPGSLESDSDFRKLNGAFAVLVASQRSLAIITDPMGFTQVYVARDSQGRILSVGTHPDCVACVAGPSPALDMASCAEFLRWGNPSFPNTMYRDVKEIEPGRLHLMDMGSAESALRSIPYWLPPAELGAEYDVKALANQLASVFVASVRDRSDRGRVGVSLSGGKDSRLVMACVPKEIDCVGITFGDYPNRESRTAQRVARAYRREFVFLQREEDFLADHMVSAIKLTGCEFDWLHAHALGFADRINALDVRSILTGVGMDLYLKGAEATDWVCRKRMKGLLPDVYAKIGGICTGSVSESVGLPFVVSVVAEMDARRNVRHAQSMNAQRGSAEWLKVYPYSSDNIGASWSAERRVLPVRHVTMDRRLLEFAFRCPIELKLGSRIFHHATRRMYGSGLKIPSANDGVRPCSGHLWRLVQRVIRKSQDRWTQIAEHCGQKARIQHSWHDYPAYWRQSKKLALLRREYGPHLNCLDGVLFRGSGQALLEDENLSWEHGFRLLQLAVWVGQRKEYPVL